MEGTPHETSPFAERGAIREEEEAVDAIIAAQFENKEQLRENAEKFFALDTPEGHSIADLSEVEIEQFGIFSSHAVRRIMRAQSRKYGGKFEDKHLTIPDLVPHANDWLLTGVLMHDISHSAGLVLGGTVTDTEDSLVPKFFRFETKNDFNKREIIEEELWAYIFFKAGSGEAFENVPMRMLSRASSFEEFTTLLIERCMKNVERDNHSLIYKGNLTREETSSRYGAYEQGQEIFRDIVANPPELFIDTLRLIWDNRDNPKVLSKLFSSKVGPYIAKLSPRYS